MFLLKCAVYSSKKQDIYRKTRGKQIIMYLRINRVVPLSDTKLITITIALQKVLNESNRH